MAEVGEKSNTVKSASAWAPLRRSLFRGLWLASLTSNVGTWMHDVAASWLMTSLAPKYYMVALVQAATFLPMFLLALPSGAIADVVDRRRLLLLTQAWMMLVAAALGVLTLLDWVTPVVLLVCTFLLSMGNALMGPAWQSITPEIVPREEVPSAVALGGMSFNLSRVVGPALGGLIVAAAGPGAVFLINAASFLGVFGVLFVWRRDSRSSGLPPEHVIGAMKAGARYVRHTSAIRVVLIRAGGFILFASALWALLPLMSRRELNLSAYGYGVLLGCLGTGAVIGSVSLPRLRERLGSQGLVTIATLLMAGALLTLARVRVLIVLELAVAAAGMSWAFLMTILTISVLGMAPAWVRSRAVSIFMLVLTGGLAIGTALWGVVATNVGTPWTLTAASVGLLLGLPLMSRLRLIEHEGLDLAPSPHWPGHTGIQPNGLPEPEPEHGPVLIVVEYRIDPKHAPEFADAMRAVRPLRLRDGAMRWGLFHDMAEPSRFVESFLVESWGEHLRQHERMTVADHSIEDRVRAFHLGPSPPAVSHLIAVPGRKPSVRDDLAEAWT